MVAKSESNEPRYISELYGSITNITQSDMQAYIDFFLEFCSRLIQRKYTVLVHLYK